MKSLYTVDEFSKMSLMEDKSLSKRPQKTHAVELWIPNSGICFVRSRNLRIDRFSRNLR